MPWAEVGKWIEGRQGKANLYFLVNELRAPVNRKPAKTDIRKVVAFHIDVDVPEGEDQESTATKIVEALRGFRLEPSVIIASGGGGQAFWILPESDHIDVAGDVSKCEAAERYTRGLEQEFTSLRGAAADHCHNVDRIMRVPFTLNIPDVKKMAKGRRAAIARLIQFTDLKHPIGGFEMAPPKDGGALVPVDPGEGGAKPAATVDIDWSEVGGLVNTFTPENLRERGVAEHALLTLQFGYDLKALADEHTKIGHRVDEGAYTMGGQASYAVACALLRAGLSANQAAAVMRSPFPWNKNVRFSEVDYKRYITKAIKKAATDIAKTDKAAAAKAARAAATARGVPIWRETFDPAGLQPKPTLANAVIAIKALGIECKLDLFHLRVVVKYNDVESGLQQFISGDITNQTIGAIRSLINNTFFYDPGKQNVVDAVDEIARDHAFDPVLDYLDDCQRKWDGECRILDWMPRYFKCEDTPLHREMGLKILVGSVRRARRPGVKFDNITVLESDEGKNKSTAIRRLYGDENFSDAKILGKSDKESMELMDGVWGYEIADLAGMRKADVEHVKDSLSKQEDRARPAYGYVTESHKRRCVIWGSTNNENYLQSQTGNRRFWPVKVGRIDLEGLTQIRDQLWGEAAYIESLRWEGRTRIYKEGLAEPMICQDDWLDGDDMVDIQLDPAFWVAAGDAQEERRAIDPWELKLDAMPVRVVNDHTMQTTEVIYDALDASGEPEQRVATGTLLEHVLKIPLAQQNHNHYGRLSTVMKKLGWEKSTGALHIFGTTQRGFKRPRPPAAASSAARNKQYEKDALF